MKYDEAMEGVETDSMALIQQQPSRLWTLLFEVFNKTWITVIIEESDSGGRKHSKF